MGQISFQGDQRAMMQRDQTFIVCADDKQDIPVLIRQIFPVLNVRTTHVCTVQHCGRQTTCNAPEPVFADSGKRSAVGHKAVKTIKNYRAKRHCPVSVRPAVTNAAAGK